jgi:hypothetical protein
MYYILFQYMSAKRDKFVDLATKRVTRALRDLRLIGNLSNRAAYEYSDEDVKKIVRALQRELEAVRSRFSETGSGKGGDFTL